MRDGSLVGEVFFVKIVFLEKRNDRTRFELIRKNYNHFDNLLSSKSSFIDWFLRFQANLNDM